MNVLCNLRRTTTRTQVAGVQMGFLRRFLCASALATVASGVHAQVPKSRLASPPEGKPDVSVITPATVFLKEAVPISARLEPVVVHSGATPAARAARKQLKQVRMFRLPVGKDRPDPHLSFEDCDIYVTSVIPVPAAVPGDPDEISLGAFRDLEWLDPDPVRNVVRPGRWLVVMEQYEDTSNVFRLKQNSRETYFSGGWVLILLGVAGRQYTPEDIMRAVANMLTFKDVEAEARINNSTRTCHVAKATTIADAGVQGVELVACLPPEGDARQGEDTGLLPQAAPAAQPPLVGAS